MKKRKRLWAGLLALLLLATVSACKQEGTPTPVASAVPSQQAAEAPAEQVEITFINVGRADANLLTVDGRHYLIDTGEDISSPALLRALAAKGVDRLSGVFLTHTHSDHIGGMQAVAARYEVDMLYAAALSENKKNGENKIDLLSQSLSVPLRRLRAGDTVQLTDTVSLAVLGPLVFNTEDDNDNSLVMMLSVNGRKVLFTGDMQFAEEQTLLAQGVDLAADVLKVGNHGNPDATSNAFGQAVSPMLAFIPTDTSEDTNSANERVIAALGDAQVYVTQDSTCGYCLTIAPDGSMQVEDVAVQDTAQSTVSIVSVDKQAQLVTLQNSGEAVSLAGYLLFSERGGECFVFPQDAQIQQGETLTVGCLGGTGDYAFGEDQVWSKKKDDPAALYNERGQQISRFE